MPCCGCVERLAVKLMSHHKIDMIRAFELAEKGVERVENRDLPPPKVESGNPTDYTQACNNCPAPVGTCRLDVVCTSVSTCRLGFTCSPASPPCPAPLAHSSLVSNTCLCSKGGCVCAIIDSTKVCDGLPSCVKSGLCSYDCDAGYVWNPVTLACEPSVTAKRLILDGFVLADFV